MADPEVSSAGHKLGQLVGDWYEEHFVLPLRQQVADHLALYLDHRFRLLHQQIERLAQHMSALARGKAAGK